MDRILEGYSPWGCKELDMTEYTQVHMENFETCRKFGIRAIAMGCLWVLSRELIGSNVNLRRRQWQPTPVLLPGKSHGWRSLVGYSPWGR